MKLTTSSNLSWIAKLRYIQSVCEPPERRGPDNLVRHFFPLFERWRYRFLSTKKFDKLRSEPFYYYLLARTKYYDEIFGEAIRGNVQYIVNIGCGSDTRAHRFGKALRQKGISILECDLPEAISVKRQIVRRLRPAGHIQYLSIDLNDDAWPHFEHWLNEIGNATVMVMMEGVSPYIHDESFNLFLRLLRNKLSPGTLIAYDFKVRGFSDNLGRVGRTESPFRLAPSRELVVGYHKERGFRVRHFELSCELETRLLPDVANSGIQLFREDALVQIQIDKLVSPAAGGQFRPGAVGEANSNV
jgi:methyltransferase (TIGR00027 family)